MTSECKRAAPSLGPETQDFKRYAYSNRAADQHELPLWYPQGQQQQTYGGSKRGERHGELDGLDPRIYAERRSRNKERQRREYGDSQQKRPAKPRKQRVVPVQFAEEFPHV